MINPDRRLRRYAATVGWPVREFRNRRRNARRGAMTVASLAGLAWAGGLVARAILGQARGTGTGGGGRRPVTVRPAEHGELDALARLAALDVPLLACPRGSTAQDQQAFIPIRCSRRSGSRSTSTTPPGTCWSLGMMTSSPSGHTMLVAGEPADEDVRAALPPAPDLSSCPSATCTPTTTARGSRTRS